MQPQHSAAMHRILVVEDHPFQLIGLEIQLNQFGFFKLTPVLEMAEALRLLEGGSRYDLLLCDQHLADGYGMQLIEQAYALQAIDYAILLSGIDNPDALLNMQEAAKTRGLPLLACLSKPLNREAFLGALEPMLLGTGTVR